VLYVDEVNLLPDALVDALLDVAASGVNTVERDGVSRRHAARFVLVGTMNPEEGELRPQLLDRFGLSVALANPVDAGQRTAILRARLGFDENPVAVDAQHAAQQEALSAALLAARAALPRLAWSDEVLHHAAARAIDAGVDGMRADLVMLRAARALAALQGRSGITVGDVEAVAELALAHRRPEGGAAQPPAAAGATQQTPQHPQNPERAQAQPPAASAPQGDWGALPAQPEGSIRVQRMAGWPPKKA
jgi:magnesium chelatase subunit I